MMNLYRFAASLALVLFYSSSAQADTAGDVASLKSQIQTLSQKIYQLQSMGADDPVDMAILKGQSQTLSQKIYQLQALENSGSAAPSFAMRGQPMAAAEPVVAAAYQPEPVPTVIEPPVVAASAPQPMPAAYVPVQPQPAPVPAQAPAASEGLGKGSFPGSFVIPGTSTSLKLGGYIKLDAIEDVGSGYGSTSAKFFSLPLNNSPVAQQSAQTTLNAQQSRINLETRTPTYLGEFKTFIEGDFYGATAANSNTNGFGFQVRHAYGSLGTAPTGQLLAGQTWSNFMDQPSRPEAIDYTGPAGEIFVRQAQIRYTHDVGPTQLSASIEAPFGSGTATQNGVTFVSTGTVGTAQGKLPDLVLRGDYNYAKDGYVSLRGLGTELNINRSIGANNFTKTAYGYGVAMSGKQGVFGDDAILYDVHGGYGTGRYMFDITATAAYYNDTTNKLYVENYYGGTLGYKHYWSKKFRSNLSGGFMREVNTVPLASLTAVQQTAENKYVASASADIIWQPTDAFQLGLEYMRGYRKVQNGEEGNLNRIQSSFIYGF